MDSNEISKMIKDYTKKIQESKQELCEIFKNGLVPWMKEMRAKHPRLNTLSWTQYTPGFNDGDPCVFTVNNYDVAINRQSSDEEEPDENDELSISVEERLAIKEEFSSLFDNIPSEIYEDLWGNGSRVIIDFEENKIRTEYYDCGY